MSTKDAVATMGAVLPDDAGGRDAVHVAVVAVVAGAKLMPGMDVGLLGPAGNPAGEHQAADMGEKNIGIVDPFIKGVVWPGQRFWLYLYPRTITALSHRWSHPAFPDGAPAGVYAPPSSKLESEKWLREFVTRSDCPSYEEVMGAASRIADGDNDAWDGEYMHFDGRDAHGDIPPEFWDHAEVVLGRKVQGKKPAYFSCSC